MTALPFVPVEGQLARPSLMPFSGLPFGREWTRLAGFRAQLRTTFVDPNAPHRACQWRPLRRAALANGIAAPTASSVSIPASGGPHRMLRAACCALGAFGLIGWLVWSQTTHRATPAALSTPAAASAPTDASASLQRPDTPPQRKSNTSSLPPVPPSAGRLTLVPVTRATVSEPPPARLKQDKPAAKQAHPPLKRTARRDTTPSRAMPHRARPPVVATHPPDRQASQSATTDPAALAEWRALYAELRDARPAAPPETANHRPPAATGDWPNQLQHRRLTADPERFTR